MFHTKSKAEASGGQIWRYQCLTKRTMREMVSKEFKGYSCCKSTSTISQSPIH